MGELRLALGPRAVKITFLPTGLVVMLSLDLLFIGMIVNGIMGLPSFVSEALLYLVAVALLSYSIAVASSSFLEQITGEQRFALT